MERVWKKRRYPSLTNTAVLPPRISLPEYVVKNRYKKYSYMSTNSNHYYVSLSYKAIPLIFRDGMKY